MDYYLDIKIVPDAEVPIYFIRNKVYSKLHKVLSALKSTDIGVSFPCFKIKLGNTIRLHGEQKNLLKLQEIDWLGALSGYCDIGKIILIPDDIKGYRTVSRIQSNMTESKLRRLIKRGSISPEEVKKYRAKMFQKGLDNPYVELESSSNGHKYRRYIAFSELSDTPKSGEFDQFGLSKEATIPWF